MSPARPRRPRPTSPHPRRPRSPPPRHPPPQRCRQRAHRQQPRTPRQTKLLPPPAARRHPRRRHRGPRSRSQTPWRQRPRSGQHAPPPPPPPPRPASTSSDRTGWQRDHRGAQRTRADLSVRADGIEVGRTTADGQGAWALVLAEPLPPGPHVLTLRQRAAEGQELASVGSVLMTVPGQTQAPPHRCRRSPC